MAIQTGYKYIVQAPGVYGGKQCIEGHRIAMHDIAVKYLQGFSPDQIAENVYPTLTPAQVYSALAYYFDHQASIDREVAEEADEIRTNAQADRSESAVRLHQAIADHKRQIGPA